MLSFPRCCALRPAPYFYVRHRVMSVLNHPLVLVAAFSIAVTSWQPSKCFAAAESFSLREPIYADYGHGKKKDLLGYLAVCVRIAHKPKQHIYFDISMPDSGQILSTDAPFTRSANGKIIFNFDDDGWGNTGRGTFRKVGTGFQLFVEQVGVSADGNANVGRLYGTYTLSRGSCR